MTPSLSCVAIGPARWPSPSAGVSAACAQRERQHGFGPYGRPHGWFRGRAVAIYCLDRLRSPRDVPGSAASVLLGTLFVIQLAHSHRDCHPLPAPQGRAKITLGSGLKNILRKRKGFVT